MSYFTIGHRLPHILAAPLFGDRARWGLKIDHSDPMWQNLCRTHSSGAGSSFHCAKKEILAFRNTRTRHQSGCSIHLRQSLKAGHVLTLS